MSDKIEEFNTDSLRQIAREVVLKRFILNLHLIIYISVNILLFVINYFTSDDYLTNIYSRWHIWALFGWGIGLGLHITQYLIFKRGVTTYSTIALIYHTVIYVLVSLLLVYIDWISDSTAPILDWFLWPLGGWGAIWIIHIILYIYTKPSDSRDENKSWIDRKVDSELARINKN
jgi:hypothetical protein